MKKYATCCSFVAQLNCNKTEKKLVNSESIIFQNISPTPTASAHLFGQDFPPAKKGSANIFSKLWHTKKTSWFDSPRIKSQRNAPTRSIYNFHGFLEHKKTLYPDIPLRFTWILHGLINDVIYIAPGVNRCPPKALFDLGCMDAIGISDQAHGLRHWQTVHLWPRWKSVEISVSAWACYGLVFLEFVC